MVGRRMGLAEDPEVNLALQLFAERLREKGKDKLAFKIENLIDLITDEVEKEIKAKPRK
jgi:hypothetical protein